MRSAGPRAETGVNMGIQVARLARALLITGDKLPCRGHLLQARTRAGPEPCSHCRRASSVPNETGLAIFEFSCRLEPDAHEPQSLRQGVAARQRMRLLAL